MTNVTSDQLLAQLEADGILKVHVPAPCDACEADLADQHGGHYDGCGNAGRYEDEGPTRPRPLPARDCPRCWYPHDGTSRFCTECVREERDRDQIDATEARS